jgi:hypothetical protein
MPKKFRTIWDGPYRVKSRKSTLNYLIENQHGKEQVVHINRLKKANNPGIWERKEQKRRVEKKPRQQQEPEEDEELIPSAGPITITSAAPHIVDRQPAYGTPEPAH